MFIAKFYSMKQKGFSIFELILVLGLMAILASIAFPNILKYFRDYKFNDYGGQIDYLVKYAKIYAMEKTTNVGICVNSANKILTIRDIGRSRGAGICSGSVIKSMPIAENYISLAGSGASLDPRGVTIFSGYVCVSYNNRHIKVCLSKASVRTIKGSGECSPCSS